MRTENLDRLLADLRAEAGTRIGPEVDYSIQSDVDEGNIVLAIAGAAEAVALAGGRLSSKLVHRLDAVARAYADEPEGAHLAVQVKRLALVAA